MARTPKYRFGKHEFTSKDAVKRFASAMRAWYGVGATVTDLDDIAFLRDLIQGHVERGAKIGDGVSRFFVHYAPDHHPADCFWIERTDGSKTDFGVPACLQEIGRVNRMSLRMAIRGDLDLFKTQALAGCGDTFVSQFSGKLFALEEAVADHLVPFETIIEKFFGERGIDLGTVMLTRSVDQKSDPVWVDEVLLSEFLTFHRTFPLRLVHWRENLSEVKKSAAS